MKPIVLLALALITQTGYAQEVSPGLWELSMETRVDAAPGFAPPPTTLSQCFSPADARDPGRIIGTVATPGASDCNYSERSYQGSTFRFTLQCAGSFALQTRGQVTFSASEFAGDVETSSDLGGQHVQFKSHLRGKRLGGC